MDLVSQLVDDEVTCEEGIEPLVLTINPKKEFGSIGIVSEDAVCIVL